MTKAEKSFFKKFHSAQNRNGTDVNVYMKFFDELNRASVYDEIALKQKLGKKESGQFSYLKYYLQQQILESLHALHYRNGGSVESMMNEAALLFSRGLDSAGEALLQRAKKIALEREDFIRLMNVLQMRSQMLQRSSLQENPSGHLEEMEKVVHAQYSITSYQKLYN